MTLVRETSTPVPPASSDAGRFGEARQWALVLMICTAASLVWGWRWRRVAVEGRAPISALLPPRSSTHSEASGARPARVVLVLRPNDCAERLASIDSLNALWRTGEIEVDAIMLVPDSTGSDWYRLGLSAGIQFPLHLGDPVAWQRAVNLLEVPATPFVLAYDHSGAVRAVLPSNQITIARLHAVLDRPSSRRNQ